MHQDTQQAHDSRAAFGEGAPRQVAICHCLQVVSTQGSGLLLQAAAADSQAQ